MKSYKRTEELPSWTTVELADELVRIGLLDAVIIEDGVTYAAQEVDDD